MASITITLEGMSGGDIDAKLTKARALVTLLEEAQRMAAELAGVTSPGGSSPTKSPDQAPPQAVAATNGHGPKPAGATKPRRKWSEEVKVEAARAAREVGATKVAEQLDVVPSQVRAWMRAHPKESAVAEPIKGTPPRNGESHEEWEARRRAAAGASL